MSHPVPVHTFKTALRSGSTVVVVGVEGGVGRTLICRLLARSVRDAVPQTSVVILDGVSALGRLTRDIERPGLMHVSNFDAAVWPDDGWLANLSQSQGTLVMGAHHELPAAAPIRPTRLLEAHRFLTSRADLVVVDTSGAPWTEPAAELVARSERVVVVALATKDGLTGVVDYLGMLAGLGVTDLQDRFVIAARRTRPRTPIDGIVAANDIEQRVGIRVVEIPLVQHLNERRAPRQYRDAGRELVASLAALEAAGRQQ